MTVYLTNPLLFMNKLVTALLLTFMLPLGIWAQSAMDAAIALTAEYQGSPTEVTLSWNQTAPSADVLLIRREKGTALWFLIYQDTASAPVSIVDNTVVPGTTYEYGMQKVENGVVAFGYASVAIEAPIVESRGTVLVFCEEALMMPLASELNRMQRDLAGDGWDVVWHTVTTSDGVEDIKTQIVSDYTAAPDEVKSVLLFGDIPVPYSGNTNWDGHADHTGAWPADTYYSDVDGMWTDNNVNNTAPARNENDNVPNDGKYDQSIVPTTSELAVGRIDFSNLDPAVFNASHTELYRRYLNKHHNWRVGDYTVDNKAIVDDNFGYFGGEAFAANGYRNGYAIVGVDNVVDGDFFDDTDTASFLLGYGCGGGTYTSAGGVGNSTDFATDSVNIVFSMLFGSYHGDWDYSPNPFMPSALASKGGILSCSWAGRPHWFYQHLASGETLGYSTVETQNSCDNDGYPNYFGSCGSHSSLLGDPTLRAHIIAPPTNVSLSPACDLIDLNWDASADPGVVGYQVFRSTEEFSGYSLVSPGLINTLTFTDNNPPADTLYYQVRAIKMESGGTGGSYWNNSTGAFANLIFTGGTNPDISANGGLVTCYNPEDTLRGYSDTQGATFEWSGPNGFMATTQNTLASDAGDYTLTVTAPNGCTSTTTVQLIVDTTPPTVSAMGGTITCDGPAQLTGTAGGSATWTGPNGFTSTDLNPTATEAGIYTLTALDIFNGCEASTTVTVDEDLVAPALTTTGATITCIDGMPSISVESDASNNAYTWMDGGGNTISSAASASVSAAGTYTVTVENTDNGCTSTASVDVLEDTTVPDLSIAGDTLTCDQATVSICANSNVPNVTYVWTGPATMGTSACADVSAAGTYTVVVTNTSNGCTSTDNFELIVDGDVPNASAIGGLLTCFNDADTVRGVSSTSGVTFSWTGPNGFTANTQNAVVMEPGTYILTVTAPNGCSATATTEVIADTEVPDVSASVNDTINCITSSVMLMGSSSGQIFWEGPNGFFTDEANPVVSAPGVYTLTGLSLFNGCTATATIEVIGDTEPPAIEAVDQVLYCEDSEVTLTVNTNVDVILAWPGLPGGQNPVVSEPGAYLVVANSQLNGCSAMDTAYVTQQLPFLAAMFSPALIDCNGDLTVAVGASGGTMPYTYVWSNGETTEGATIANGTGDYNVVVIDANGCDATLEGNHGSIDVLVVAGSFTNESAPGAADGTATADASGGTAPYTYSWSNGATTATITGLTAATYTATITDANGCSQTVEVVVDVTIGTNQVPEGWQVQLSPNPASTQARLMLQFAEATDAHVTIRDFAGREVYSQHTGSVQSSMLEINLSSLPAAMYFVSIQAENKVYSTKLVVSK